MVYYFDVLQTFPSGNWKVAIGPCRTREELETFLKTTSAMSLKAKKINPDMDTPFRVREVKGDHERDDTSAGLVIETHNLMSTYAEEKGYDDPFEGLDPKDR